MSLLRIPYRTALLGAAAVSATLAAQTPFESHVDLVALDVCVTDRQGRSVPVNAGDLVVFDNGAPQHIVLFSAGERVPLALTLLVDSSQSMHGGLLDRAAAAAGALIRQLPEDSLVEVMSFNDHAALRYPMGSDHALAEQSLAELSPVGATALYEAVMLAIRDQEHARRHRAERYREAIVVLTDGEDTGGHVAFDEVLDEARRSGILVYPVVLPPHDAQNAGPPWQMTQLGLDTGGETVAARHPDDLTSIYERIAADVRGLYRVGYVPSPLVRDGAWHQVQVRAAGKDLVLRTRSGYYAAYQ